MQMRRTRLCGEERGGERAEGVGGEADAAGDNIAG